jgi:urea transporter
METNFSPESDTLTGTVGGTLFVVLIHISSGEILKTAVLAAIGAAVSFSVSWGLKFLVKQLKRKR